MPVNAVYMVTGSLVTLTKWNRLAYKFLPCETLHHTTRLCRSKNFTSCTTTLICHGSSSYGAPVTLLAPHSIQFNLGSQQPFPAAISWAMYHPGQVLQAGDFAEFFQPKLMYNVPLLMLLFTGYGRVLASSTTKFSPGCCSRKEWTPETFSKGSLFTYLHTHVCSVMFNWRKHSCTYSGIVNILKTAGRLLPPVSSEEFLSFMK